MNTPHSIRCNWFVGILAFLLPVLFFMGCSTTPAPKPQESKIQPHQRAVVRTQFKAPVSLSGSSLDVYREGKAPVPGPLKDIYFDFDQYGLRADAPNTLKAHAKWLKDNASAQVKIEGHCDERGTGEYNLALAAKRGCQIAKEYLVTSGLPANRIVTVSYGKESPVCAEHTEACWQRNRRDRFVVKQAPIT